MFNRVNTMRLFTKGIPTVSHLPRASRKIAQRLPRTAGLVQQLASNAVKHGNYR